MRTITTTSTLYKFEELSDSAKAKALDKLRHWHVEDFDWWDYLYDDFKERLKEFGYNVKDINFSGFWSQGDGAKFNGTVVKDHSQCLALLQARACDLATRVREHNAKCRLLEWFELEITISGSIKSIGHYEHSGEMTLSADLEFNGEDEPYDESHPLQAERVTLVKEIDNAAPDLFAAVLEEARGHADDLYRELEKEYEWLTSDKQVADSIVANELEFTEDGDLA